MKQNERTKGEQPPRIYSVLDCICHIAQEKIPTAGEDSYCYSISEDSVLVGVFDGCGGSGAKKYPVYQEKTGAYMGARAVAGAVLHWFEDEPHFLEHGRNNEAMKAAIGRSLTVCKENAGSQGSKIRGSISKEFPTTAAIARCVVGAESVFAECYWAGDSRVYLLDEDGLAQLTSDDLDDLDAFENLSGDGVMTNVISASKVFTLHSRSVEIRKPCILFAATDGCFGYIPSPMEFESLLLEQLENARSLEEFEEKVRQELTKVAGDDFTLVGAVLGFGTFSNLKRSLGERCQKLKGHYLSGIDPENPESRRRIWNRYSRDYYRYYEK